MKTAIEAPPRTMMEVYQMLPEGTLVELIDNQLYISPSPVFNHHNVCKAIMRKLLEYVEDAGLGQIFIAPFDVYLDEVENTVQPDLTVVLRENFHIIRETGYIHGVPDLIVEVLSKGNKDHDLIRKKDLYKRFGVKEYWIVDPDSKLALGFMLQNNAYKLIAEDIGVINSALLNISITF
jgi:Uma2 family endonuclease